MTTTASYALDLEDFLAATVPMRTEALNSIENVRPQFMPMLDAETDNLPLSHPSNT